MQPASLDVPARTRIVAGSGCLGMLGELVGELGVSRVLLVSDAGVVQAGHVERALGVLRRHHVHAELFEDVEQNPTAGTVHRAADAARSAGAEGFVGLGGGSAMDTAKGAALIACCGGRIEDYCGDGKAFGEVGPILCIPTTAGTGSEVQRFALISEDASHAKMAIGDARLAARVAVLDPALTVTQPRGVTAHTGIDALAHALESLVCRRANRFSQMLSRQAFLLLERSLPMVLEEPDHLAARADCQLGACLAGLAIELSMLGAAHSAANPLTAHAGVVHGQAVGVMLPAVLRLNCQSTPAWQEYGELARVAGLTADAGQAEVLIGRVERLLDQAGLHRSLGALGVDRGLVPTLAQEAAGQWTAQYNPVAVGAEQFHALYEAAF